MSFQKQRFLHLQVNVNSTFKRVKLQYIYSICLMFEIIFMAVERKKSVITDQKGKKRNLRLGKLLKCTTSTITREPAKN